MDVPVPQDDDDNNKDQLSNTDARIEAVEKSISELHESVTKKTGIRQEQQSEVATLIASNAAATDLLKLCRTLEQIVGVPSPQIRKEIAKVMQLIPQERTSDRVVEQTVDIPSPQIQEQAVDVVKVIPRKHLQQRTADADNQPGVRIQVFKGECSMTTDSDLLCKFHLDGSHLRH